MLDFALIVVVLPVVAGAVSVVTVAAALRNRSLAAPVAAVLSVLLSAIESAESFVTRGGGLDARRIARSVEAADRRVFEGVGRGAGFAGRCASLLARAASTGRVRTYALVTLAGAAALVLALAVFGAK